MTRKIPPLALSQRIFYVHDTFFVVFLFGVLPLGFFICFQGEEGWGEIF